MRNSLDAKERPWPVETRRDRLQRCRLYLFHHDMLTEEESDRLAAKIAAAARKGKPEPGRPRR